jgi:uncharacterized protein YbjT (DUF2867 family)
MIINLFGATGLTGQYLLNECLAHPRVHTVRAFVRKPLTIEHPKLVTVITTANMLDTVADQITGDVVFNCLGTTIRQTGSQAAQYAIDCTYPVQVAAIAARNGVRTMVSVSSVGASPTGNFYLRTKSDMEKGVTAHFGERAYFVRPSFLLGNRPDVRTGERIGIVAAEAIQFLLVGGLRKYRSVHGGTVAQAMLAIALAQPAMLHVLHYDDLVYWAKRK